MPIESLEMGRDRLPKLSRGCPVGGGLEPQYSVFSIQHSAKQSRDFPPTIAPLNTEY